MNITQISLSHNTQYTVIRTSHQFFYKYSVSKKCYSKYCRIYFYQTTLHEGDHSPGNVKFYDISLTFLWHSYACCTYPSPTTDCVFTFHTCHTHIIVTAHCKTHSEWCNKLIISISDWLNYYDYAATVSVSYNIFPWQDFFPDNSLTTAKFPDISRFSRKVVTPYQACRILYQM